MRSSRWAPGPRQATGDAPSGTSPRCVDGGFHPLTRSKVTHLVIGRAVAPRGLHGELKIAIETDDPERFRRLREVYLGDGLVRFEVKRARLHRGQALLQLGGIEDRTAAERLRHRGHALPLEDALPLADGEYYYHQVEGLTVVTLEGKVLGRVTEVLPTGANDVYVVQGGEGEILLPALRDVIIRIDLDAGTMVVRPPDGLY